MVEMKNSMIVEGKIHPSSQCPQCVSQKTSQILFIFLTNIYEISKIIILFIFS